MFRKPLFWLALGLASISCLYFTVRNFSRAFPIVTLDLKMNRDAALAGAQAIAARYQLPPAGFRQVASFGGDQQVQNFVELEAGGTPAFQRMMADGLYHPYRWTVRHYKPGETRETSIFFTPAGALYGFAVRLPEKESGPVMEPDAAQALAEKHAANDWKIDFAKYRLAEKSRELRPGGRADYTFVYERTDAGIGEGRYRMRLVVGGDRLTELIHFVKVPEAFSRRYEEMRSSNNLISGADTIALAILYLVGGCIGGLFFLLRKRSLVWRPAVVWGVFIAFLQLLEGLNQWPLSWMGYDTALSPGGFMAQQAMILVALFLAMSALLSVSFIAAEGLTRLAFPQMVQHWRLWSKDVAPSGAISGYTAGGYLLVAVFFAYEVVLYFVTSKWLGWWTPSDALVQPDVLSTYMPWLSAIAPSAQAGFWEECLFRAVPLAGAALLGGRFGGRKWWIAGAMLLQALIFGGGHAGYANQPAYARVVELIIPSLMFGGIYLRFGLLPAIVLHYTFDVVWFALPLFVSTAPGIWTHRGMVILLTFVPLLVVVIRRLQAGRWVTIDQGSLNGGWRPPEIVPQAATAAPAVSTGAVSPLVLKLLPLAGLVGFALWIGLARFRADAPALTIGRAEAETLARQVLEERGVRLGAPWKTLAAVAGSADLPDRFVWQTAGRDAYARLMNDYLQPPHWRVRFARFEGDVAERAEEYQVLISDARRVFRVRHILPEARPGAGIAEDAARRIAQEAIRKQFNVDPAALKEISAVPSQLKARTDWVVTFSDPQGVQLPQGEKRLTVLIAGDEVAGVYKLIHVPEEWERQERDRRNIPGLLANACRALIVLAALAGMGTAIFHWSRKRFARRAFLILAAVLAVLSVLELLNALPESMAAFMTAQPFKVQLFLVVGMGGLGMLLFAFGIGTLGGLVKHWLSERENAPFAAPWLPGISLGCLLAGLSAAAQRVGPSPTPVWGDFSGLAHFAPFFTACIGPLASFLSFSAIALWIVGFIDRHTAGGARNRTTGFLLLALTGVAFAGTRGIDTIASWLIAGAVLAVLLLSAYLLVLRHHLPILIVGLGTGTALGLVRGAFLSPCPGSMTAAVAGIILISGAAWLGFDALAGAPEGVQSDGSPNQG